MSTFLTKSALGVLSILATRQWEDSGSQHLIGMNTGFEDSQTWIQIPVPGLKLGGLGEVLLTGPQFACLQTRMIILTQPPVTPESSH